MIAFQGVSKLFGGVRAVDGIDLTIFDHELCVLVGPSGSGKSTMLRMINRLIEPSNGAVTLDGKDVRALRPELLRRGIGYVIQSVGLFPHLTVAANIATVPELVGWSRARTAERVRQMLSLVGMDPKVYGARYPRELSGGGGAAHRRGAGARLRPSRHPHGRAFQRRGSREPAQAPGRVPLHPEDA
jgi:osmoprotectant transport system ATP-binding protein